MSAPSDIACLMVGILLFTGCASVAPRPAKSGAPPPARPALRPDGAAAEQPVYVMPQVEAAWVNPSGDEKEWRSGYVTATVVSPGHFTTREEAERSGRRYIVPGADGPATGPAPAPPSPPPDPGAASPFRDPPTATTPARPGPPELPRVRFSTSTNELFIFPGGSEGATLSVETPLGPVLLVYTAGRIVITARGREIVVEQPTTEPRRVLLP